MDLKFLKKIPWFFRIFLSEQPSELFEFSAEYLIESSWTQKK